jgi:hypothetical protein
VFNNIIAFVDSNKKIVGKKYGEIEIISKNELQKYKYPVLIATSLRYINTITDIIRSDLRLDNEILKLHKNYDFNYKIRL